MVIVIVGAVLDGLALTLGGFEAAWREGFGLDDCEEALHGCVVEAIAFA
jgi:hypothetical protein